MTFSRFKCKYCGRKLRKKKNFGQWNIYDDFHDTCHIKYLKLKEKEQ
jgi:hypothetical protein